MTTAPRSFSSIAAFLALLHALRAAPGRTADDDRLLATMTDALAGLTQPERDAIVGEANDAANTRHRQRAMLKLSRELLARRMLAG